MYYCSIGLRVGADRCIQLDGGYASRGGGAVSISPLIIPMTRFSGAKTPLQSRARHDMSMVCSWGGKNPGVVDKINRAHPGLVPGSTGSTHLFTPSSAVAGQTSEVSDIQLTLHQSFLTSHNNPNSRRDTLHIPKSSWPSSRLLLLQARFSLQLPLLHHARRRHGT